MGGRESKPISYSIDLDPRAGALRFHVCGLPSLPAPAAAAVHFTEKRKDQTFLFFSVQRYYAVPRLYGGTSGQNCIESNRSLVEEKRRRRSLWSRVFSPVIAASVVHTVLYVPPPT